MQKTEIEQLAKNGGPQSSRLAKLLLVAMDALDWYAQADYIHDEANRSEVDRESGERARVALSRVDEG